MAYKDYCNDKLWSSFQFIERIKTHCKILTKHTDYATYDDYDSETHDDENVFWDRGRNFAYSDILELIEKFEKGEFPQAWK